MKVALRNLGTVNKNEVRMLSTDGNAQVTMTFSYETCVGVAWFIGSDCGRLVRQNDWSTTTGKLLNELESDKSKRVDGETFNAKLDEILKNFNA